MRIRPLILAVLLAVQLGFPYDVCRAGERCHDDMLAEMEEEVSQTHACCTMSSTVSVDKMVISGQAACGMDTVDHDADEQSCQDDCSCSCCRTLVNVYWPSTHLLLPAPPVSERPIYQPVLQLREFDFTIWEPPRVA